MQQIVYFVFLYKSLIMYSICKFFLLQRQCMFFTYTIMNHLVTEKHRNFEQEWACPKFQLWRHEFGESWLGICMSRDLFSIRTMYIYRCLVWNGIVLVCSPRNENSCRIINMSGMQMNWFYINKHVFNMIL